MPKTDEAIQRHFHFSGRNRNLPWYPREGKRHKLAQLFGILGMNEGVEVGTYRGFWAEYLFQMNPKLHLTCIDPWVTYDGGGRSPERQVLCYEETQSRLKNFNVTIIKDMSMSVVGQFKDGSLDFVYIDGNHAFNYAIMDIIHWVPKVRTEGIVAIHDYHHQVGCDVIEAVNAYTRVHHIDPWYITREEWPTAFWVRK